MSTPNQSAHAAAVAASVGLALVVLTAITPARADDGTCGDRNWRSFNEQAELLTLLRTRTPTPTDRSEMAAYDESVAFADARYLARCLADAIANGRDPAPIIESLRVLGEWDLKQ